MRVSLQSVMKLTLFLPVGVVERDGLAGLREVLFGERRAGAARWRVERAGAGSAIKGVGALSRSRTRDE